MKLDELIKEIQDLKEKEIQLEYLKKDKKKMADKLLEYELKEYENNSVEEEILSLIKKLILTNNGMIRRVYENTQKNIIINSYNK